ncbi:iron-containing alcohol dehydrogenase [Leucobacter sp. wl10]|uniref:iron-containing alcohol dehydrogenase n=1 Tax=Leucobacter sp. wl10 TaxID=2304677 RepID=UPI002110994C|nr:iron-containing alcohol dehydrogenase [Leucobacter sp. wl10]
MAPRTSCCSPTRPALLLVAIPSTAGTGSEATRTTVITNSESGEKMLCKGPSYLPRAAIVDYELTHSMPPIHSAGPRDRRGSRGPALRAAAYFAAKRKSFLLANSSMPTLPSSRP